MTTTPYITPYTRADLVRACRAMPGGRFVLDRERARSFVRVVFGLRRKLPRVGASLYVSTCDGGPDLIIESGPGGVITCRLAPDAAPVALQWEIVEARTWVRDDGATASIYGAAPWLTEAERPRWTLRADGWTVRNPHTGEVGACRPPVATREAAEALAAQLGTPSRIGIGD